MSEHVEEARADEPDTDLVHWMEPRPLTIGAVGISAAAAGAFALGAVTAVTVLALLHWLRPTREILPPRSWRLH